MAEPDLAKVQEQLDLVRPFIAAPFVVALQGTIDLARFQSAHVQELRRQVEAGRIELALTQRALSDALDRLGR